uniref:Uncharacterized protein n=2 Tax=Bombyx mori TaxID=7091 RepID=A0A8R2DP46_BOMMO|nr:fibrohexamerin-like [Bombyx mori]
MLIKMLIYWFSIALFVQCECFNIENDVEASNIAAVQYNDHDKIRPCSHFDLNCIRAYFKQHSSCVVSHGPVPDPLKLQNIIFHLPHANMSFVLRNSNVGGLNGKVVEFYVNKKTHKLVLAAEMKEVTLESSQMIAKYSRKAKEPIELNDGVSGNYGTITFTTVFPDMTNLYLAEAETNSYIEDSNVKYYIGPKMSTSAEVAVSDSFDRVRKNLGLDLQEGFVFLGPIFMANFIQYNICDFGIKYG